MPKLTSPLSSDHDQASPNRQSKNTIAQTKEIVSFAEANESIGPKTVRLHCIRIRTRLGIYDQIYPSA